MGFRRGDIVWARVQFPAKWWPGLVQGTHGHRVAVSFFDDAGKSRHFLETEVCSFEENFDSLAKTIKNSSRGGKLLEFSLALIARRAAYGLKCRCHFRPLLSGGSGAKQSKIRDSFRPDELLGFVNGLAVSPVVGDSDFVVSVTLASQVNAFRRFIVVEQKLSHRKATGSCSVAQSLDVLKTGIVCANRQASLDEINLTYSSCERCMEGNLPVPIVILDPPEEAQQSKSASTLIDHSRDKEELLMKASIHERIDALFCSKESSRESNSQSADTSQMEHNTSIGNHELSVKGTCSSKESCSIDSTTNRLLVPLVNEADEPKNCRESDKISVKAIGRKRVDPRSTSKGSPTKKPKADKLSARVIYASCHNLYMKFPRDFKLPSKMDLIKKFRGFGQIDLVRTKVFERMGSAQVVFVHPFDAMTAYLYAKFKSSLFHGALVLYWLDRYEQKRSHSRLVAPLAKLKSCLKSPVLSGKEEKKPVRKVRFSM